MTDSTILEWAVAIGAMAVVAWFVVWLIERVSKDRLMRCPEAGCVAFVDVEQVSHPGGQAPEIRVRNCELWPQWKDCARGCLARYGDTAPGFRINLDALKPFEK